MIEVELGFRPFDPGRIPDRLAVNQKLEVVDPELAVSAHQDAEEKLLGVGPEGERNGVLLPILRAAHPLTLHVFKGKVGRIAILAHPESYKPRYVLETQPAAHLERFSGKLDWQRF